MEEILDTYQQPYDSTYPVVCMDEKPYQLLNEAQEPTPMKKGKPGRVDNEYIRERTCSIFIFTDWAHQVKHMAPEARELAKKLEIRYTPTIELLHQELSAWNIERNKNQRGVDWQFTTSDARTKLKRLYPEII